LRKIKESFTGKIAGGILLILIMLQKKNLGSPNRKNAEPAKRSQF
jgi:hypothetical protein